MQLHEQMLKPRRGDCRTGKATGTASLAMPSQAHQFGQSQALYKSR